ncbi:zinc-ribbon domain-containing protein [Pseudooceanicola sp. MF1-13]|uniref:zinc-ribbon domain-containing protein n=1 Tax=Pseudooceanicola sp. MF1-13 TaxID=3379095 RepID=UPI0038916B30
MRLTCPNCGAEYEVPDEVMPASGRDVQCSNCGDTWFQYHPDHMPEDAAQDAPAQTASSRYDDAEDEDFDDGWDDGSADDTADEEEDLGDASDWEDETPEPAPVPEEQQPLRRKPLSPEVKSILQEEAQYESRARQGDPLESQPDLGLGVPDPATAKRESLAENRLARARTTQAAEPPRPKTEDSGSRRELLPDIEEINSTLRRKGETMRRPERTSARAAAKQQRSGFRRGFMSILILAIVGAVIYLQAPKIAAAIPQLAGAMESYVAAVDQGRVWLDTKAAELAQKLDDMSTEVAPDTGAEPAPDASN